MRSLWLWLRHVWRRTWVRLTHRPIPSLPIEFTQAAHATKTLPAWAQYQSRQIQETNLLLRELIQAVTNQEATTLPIAPPIPSAPSPSTASPQADPGTMMIPHGGMTAQDALASIKRLPRTAADVSYQTRSGVAADQRAAEQRTAQQSREGVRIVER